MKSQPILAAAMGALLVMPVAARAQSMISNMVTTTQPTGTGMNSLTAGDKDFVRKAAQGGMIEVETSKLAKKNSSNDSVKVFAQMMIDDHKKSNAQLKKIAKSMNVSVARDLDTEHQGELDELKGAKGGAFDQTYISIQDKEHNGAVALFQKEADDGDNQQLKEFATKLLPTLRMHVEKVKELEAKVPPAATSSVKQ